MSRLQENKGFVELLLNSHNLQVEALLKSVNIKQTYLVCEIVLNILEGVLQLTPIAKTRLKKYKTIFRNLTKRRGSIKSKQKLIISNSKALLLLLKSVNKQLKSQI